MESAFPYAGPLEKFLELLIVEVAATHRATLRVAEDEFRAGQTLGQQSGPVADQGVDRHLRNVDPTPSAGRLGFRERQLAVQLLKRSLNHDRLALEVDVRPLQTKQLSEPHAGRDREDVHRLEAIALGGFEQLGHFVDRQRRDLGSLDLGALHVGADVER